MIDSRVRGTRRGVTTLPFTAASGPRMAQELRADDICVHFEGVKAVDGTSLVLQRKEILGLVGPNGAGKTTLVNVLSGFQRPTSGSTHLGTTDTTGWAPDRLGRAGLVRTFQGARLFADLTTFENVELGALGVGSSRREARNMAWTLLERMNLTDRASQRAGSLPHGDERLVGLLRALATKPAFLLLDEPAGGLNDVESAELTRVLKEIRDDFGCGMLVIEHDMRLIGALCERLQVLDRGRTIGMGKPSDVLADEQVMTAYLGAKRARARGGANA